MIDDEPNLTRLVAKRVTSHDPATDAWRSSSIKHANAAQTRATAQKWALGPWRPCPRRKRASGFNPTATLFVPNCAAVWPVPTATPAANTAVLIVADQKRKNRSARIVGNCRFFGVQIAQSACNSRRKDYLISQRNLIASRTMSTTSNPQQSAKIYQFPVGGRRAVEGNREEMPTTSTFGSWYHDAAIQEATAQNHREH